MKVFMSWSGAISKAVAELLSEWTKCVVQETQPWISTSGIDRGTVWFSKIGEELNTTSVGIICLTHENKNKPWILFEAGALAKGLASAKVCTFLIDLEPQDLESPLSQFNHTTSDRNGLFSLMVTLNNSIANPLPLNILEKVFNTNWEWFNEDFQAIKAAHPPAAPPEPRSQDSIMNELLENTRSINSRLRVLEDRSPKIKGATRRLEISELPRKVDWTSSSSSHSAQELLEIGCGYALSLLQNGTEVHAVKNMLILRGYQSDDVKTIMDLVDETVHGDLKDKLNSINLRLRNEKAHA